MKTKELKYGINNGVLQYVGNCRSIEELQIPEGVHTIHDGAFKEAKDTVKKIIFPKSLRKINSSAVSSMKKLEEVEFLGDEIDSIGAKAFAYSDRLKRINIPNGLTRLEISTFEKCSSLSEVILPDTITEVKENVFANCVRLKKLKFPIGVKSLPNRVCASCYILEEVLMPGVVKIGASCFSDCHYLQDIKLNEGIKEIEQYTFRNCKSLTDFKCPNSVEKIHNGAFDCCTNLRTFIFSDKTTFIGTAAFNRCELINNIVLPKLLTAISERTFEGCRSLTNITLPNHLNQINAAAFKGCINLETISFSGKINTINDYAFYNCGLKNIVLPENVIHVGKSAFNNCKKLEKVSISNLDMLNENVFENCELLSSCEINSKLNEIKSKAFASCTKLKSITIPGTIEVISDNSFDFCENLKEILIDEKKQYLFKNIIKKYPSINLIDKKLNDREEISDIDLIRLYLEANIPIFLHGKPGDGKSARVKTIDNECQELYLQNETPDGINGKCIVVPNTKELLYIKPPWLVNLEERCEENKDKLCVLFLDELTNAVPAIQNLIFNLIQNKCLAGRWSLPRNARIVAAGNEIEDSISAHEITEPLMSRFSHIYIKTTADKWLIWAVENDIHPYIISFINYRKDEVLRTKFDGINPHANPRVWENASKVLYRCNNISILSCLLGESLTFEFESFIKDALICLDKILNEDYTEDYIKVLTTAQKHAIISHLVTIKIEEYDKVIKFIRLLDPEYETLFNYLWSKDDLAKLEVVNRYNLSYARSKSAQ